MKFPAVFLLIALSAAITLAAPKDDLIKGNLKFSANLYTQVLKAKRNENFVFSPFTVQTIIATLASAAPNSNAQPITEIRRVLGLPQTTAQTEEAFKDILTEMNKSDDDFKIFDSSKLYFAYGYKVTQWFINIAQSNYLTEVETINFKNSWDTANQINSWVSKKTNNTINNLVSGNDLNRNTMNILINALYVQGKWDLPFNASENVKRTFYGQNSNSQVEMMVNSGSYEYAEAHGAKLLKMELLRDGGNAYMVFILPNNGNSLAQIEQNIEAILQATGYTGATVHVTLPKFTIESDLKLKPMLQNLGINALFQIGLQLTGLRTPGHPYTKVSDVHQKSRLQVSEFGVTGAAVNEANIFIDSPPHQKEFTVTLDHPFLFQIVVDDVTVFAGRVVNL